MELMYSSFGYRSFSNNWNYPNSFLLSKFNFVSYWKNRNFSDTIFSIGKFAIHSKLFQLFFVVFSPSKIDLKHFFDICAIAIKNIRNVYDVVTNRVWMFYMVLNKAVQYINRCNSIHHIIPWSLIYYSCFGISEMRSCIKKYH